MEQASSPRRNESSSNLSLTSTMTANNNDATLLEDVVQITATEAPAIEVVETSSSLSLPEEEKEEEETLSSPSPPPPAQAQAHHQDEIEVSAERGNTLVVNDAAVSAVEVTATAPPPIITDDANNAATDNAAVDNQEETSNPNDNENKNEEAAVVEEVAVAVSTSTSASIAAADSGGGGGKTEGRDTSMCSRNSSSRDSLRMQVSTRSNTFTRYEISFLEHLTTDGSDRDVELALRTIVGNEDLFFEHLSPRRNTNTNDHRPHFRREEEEELEEEEKDRTATNMTMTTTTTNNTVNTNISSCSSSVINNNNNNLHNENGFEIGLSSSGENNIMNNHNNYDDDNDDDDDDEIHDDDATREGAAPSIGTIERRGLAVASSSLTTSASFSKHATSNNTHKNNNTDDGNTNNGNRDVSAPSSSSSPAIPPIIIGSKRRCQILQRRRSDASIDLTRLWQAHQTGLSVTASSSVRSILRRELSISSIGGGGSVASNMSGLSVLFGKHAHPGANGEHNDVFRSSVAGDDDVGDRKKNSDSSSTNNNNNDALMMMRHKALITRTLPPMTRRFSPKHRSKSINLGSLSRHGLSPQHKNLPKIPQPRSFVNSKNATAAANRAAAAAAADPRSMYAARGRTRSVTFRDFNEQLEFDTEQEVIMAGGGGGGGGVDHDNDAEVPTNNNNTRRKFTNKIVRRTVSDSQLDGLLSFNTNNNEDDEVVVQRQQLLQREGSTNSIPSLHHGQPVGGSISSIPSLHHGQPVRGSVSSIPSLHHGQPVRGSVSSIPSLHHAAPLRQDSVASFASLHRAGPIRQDSQSTIASLHHGRPIRQDSINSLSDLAAAATTTMPMISQEQMMAWVQLEDSSTVSQHQHRQPENIHSHELLKEQQEDGASPTKPLYLRQASQNIYQGEGIEVTEFNENMEPNRGLVYPTYWNSDISIYTANSFDDSSIFSSFGRQKRTSDVFRSLRRSLSDENMSTLFSGPSKEVLLQIPDEMNDPSIRNLIDDYEDISDDEGESTMWETESTSPTKGRFDAWNILKDSYCNGYGGGGTLGFKILGTSVADKSAQPHVLSPPLMESLQAFLPASKSGENFYLKYSMVRDGAHLQTLLKRARGVKYSILAIETTDGEVFGSFTGQAWRKSWNYFGTGESFLWKMRRSRLEKSTGILEQAQKESEIDVYPYTGENAFIQLCTHDRVAVGGGIPNSSVASTSSEKKNVATSGSAIHNSNSSNENYNPLDDHKRHWGFGLALQSDLLQGSSSPCITFGSPSLCKAHSDGSLFEIINIELWTTTPCMTEEDAEKLELSKLFLQESDYNSTNNSTPTHTMKRV